jgi:hypothetical protein
VNSGEFEEFLGSFREFEGFFENFEREGVDETFFDEICFSWIFLFSGMENFR